MIYQMLNIESEENLSSCFKIRLRLLIRPVKIIHILYLLDNQFNKKNTLSSNIETYEFLEKL